MMIQLSKKSILILLSLFCVLLLIVSSGYYLLLHASFETLNDPSIPASIPPPSPPEPTDPTPSPNTVDPEPSSTHIPASPLPSHPHRGSSSGGSKNGDSDVTSSIVDRCDVDGNGRVEPRDVGLVKYFFGYDPCENRYSCYDVNRDGSINYDDVELIQSNYCK